MARSRCRFVGTIADKGTTHANCEGCGVTSWEHRADKGPVAGREAVSTALKQAHVSHCRQGKVIASSFVAYSLSYSAPLFWACELGGLTSGVMCTYVFVRSYLKRPHLSFCSTHWAFSNTPHSFHHCFSTGFANECFRMFTIAPRMCCKVLHTYATLNCRL